MYKVGIITASDKGAIGERVDVSGPTIKEIVENYGYEVLELIVVPDDKQILEETMIRLSDELKCDLVLTTGGTGFSMRDITPEATKNICERDCLGIVEAIRAYSMTITKRAMLSRAYAGIRNQTLIINLPGSPKAVKESLEYVIDSVHHGMDILIGNDSNCAR